MRKFCTLITVLAAVFLIAARAPDSQWKQLFNGKDLTGWKHVGPGHMTVENGLIQTHGGMGLLYWTGGKVGHSRIRVIYKMRDANDNSGVFIRIWLTIGTTRIMRIIVSTFGIVQNLSNFSGINHSGFIDCFSSIFMLIFNVPNTALSILLSSTIQPGKSNWLALSHGLLKPNINW